MSNIDRLKRLAAQAAVDMVESGMRLGLGSGSTFRYALEAISQRLQEGSLNDIAGVPSSLQTARLATELSIPLTDLKAMPRLDLTIDGADEVDDQLNLIKGGGGALLREKVVAQASRQVLIIVDEGKLSDKLGRKWRVPTEVMPFAEGFVVDRLRQLKGDPVVRLDKNGKPAMTDQQNLIVDAGFGVINDPKALSDALSAIAGIVEHGLFVNMATTVLSAGANGIERFDR